MYQNLFQNHLQLWVQIILLGNSNYTLKKLAFLLTKELLPASAELGPASEVGSAALG